MIVINWLNPKDTVNTKVTKLMDRQTDGRTDERRTDGRTDGRAGRRAGRYIHVDKTFI